MAYNCLDRHIDNGKGNQIAFYLEGNNLGEQSTLTYRQLLTSVCKIGNYLRSIGVKKGDNVTIYMPMIAELPAAMASLLSSLQLICRHYGSCHIHNNDNDPSAVCQASPLATSQACIKPKNSPMRNKDLVFLAGDCQGRKYCCAL